MPAVRMKCRLLAECCIGNELHECPKSNEKQKVSNCPTDTYQQNPQLNSLTQEIFHNVCSEHNMGISESNNFQDIFNEESAKRLRVSQLSSDPISFAAMDPALPDLTQCGPESKPITTYINADAKEILKLSQLTADDGDDGNCDLTDLQHCDLMDYCMSDNISALPFDSLMEFSNEINYFCDKCENLDIMIDPSIPLFFGGAFEVSWHSGDLGGIGCFNPHLMLDELPDLLETNSPISPIELPKSQERKKPITLVLDLDETLVHSTLKHCDGADFTFPVFSDMKPTPVYVKKRPYLLMFLERVAEMFEIVIFTASQRTYAENVLSRLDPAGKLVSRCFSRESCIFTDGCCTKDLSILGVDLAKVAIIDNSPQVFHLQVNNGIPIKSWYDDPSDTELLQLLPFLETLVNAEDVRPIIAGKFGNKK
ncbi:CTD small phosphatase-like protein 2-B isoform X2 [Ananas comosus]|nr:CTD small phosphatase-like protein 2-B isoform X2 [Ananas comosus]OAY85129.1 CTD small phosphatase-like protein 2 [Ananas comosus]